jgi:RNA polymerase sigma-70 factor (ECF subfamily)
MDDTELVERIRRHDQDAYRILYMRHARYLAGVVFRLLGADEEVDDVLQESFVAAVEGIGKLQEPDRLRRWLVTIAVRKVTRVLSARRRRARLASSFAIIAPKAHLPSGQWSATELHRALETLPPKLRVAWVLSRVEQLELADIASDCSVSVATAKRRIAQADQRIRRWLDAR